MGQDSKNRIFQGIIPLYFFFSSRCTEASSPAGSSAPAVQPINPGSTGPGVPGIHPIVYDNDGNIVPPGAGKAGNICIQNPWPGSFQTIWRDRERYVIQYYERYCKNPKSKGWQDWPYMTGDAAVVAADGYVRILGRIDDVINVSGHRLGTKELESAAMTVAESAKSLTGPPGELATNTVLCGGRSGAGFFPGDPEESVFAVSGMTS